MKYFLTYIASLFFLTSLVSCNKNVSTNVSLEEVESTFAELLNEAINTSFETIPGLSMTVNAPELGINWTGESGFDSKKEENELEADQPFRIASVTKTFVATAILRLHEKGIISITDPISKYISSEHNRLLEKGGYAPDSITILNCLNHTSGLFDYALGGRSYLELAKKDANKRWTRTEQIELAMKSGDRIGYPGEKYRYGDTGYVLLGEIIETAVDSSLAYGLRSLLKFNEIGMNSTWLESLEDAPNDMKPQVHRYLRGNDYTEWDASIDLYGGGGLVSTTEDLALFFQHLFNNKIFDYEKTLELMMEKPIYADSYDSSKDERYKDYRQGFWKVSIYGKTGYMHNGIWGTQLLHMPELNCSISINYTHGQRDRLIKKTVLVVENIWSNKRK